MVAVSLKKFFFKQKTAYAMDSRDWSSNVCSSDLAVWRLVPGARAGVARPQLVLDDGDDVVVVAWLDRGASLPGELWRVGGKARALLPPTPRTAVTVLGLLPSPPSPTVSKESR